MTQSAARAATLLAALLLTRALVDAPPRAQPPSRRAPASGPARLLYGERLDANREPPEVLALLPGIGPARAEAIAAARPLCSLADVDRVPGIGAVTLSALAEHLTFHVPPDPCESKLRALGD